MELAISANPDAIDVSNRMIELHFDERTKALYEAIHGIVDGKPIGILTTALSLTIGAIIRYEEHPIKKEAVFLTVLKYMMDNLNGDGLRAATQPEGSGPPGRKLDS